MSWRVGEKWIRSYGTNILSNLSMVVASAIFSGLTALLKSSFSCG